MQRATANDTTANNPRFVMYGGTITGNSAGTGGGVYVDRWCNFEMHGGTVSSNTATAHEGGGLYIAAPDAKITAGNILNNTTKTTTDWGGGGMFVESRGKVTISTVKVWDNTANGLGGGISGCPHARIGVSGQGMGDITEGAAIYGNTAHKNARPNNEFLYALQFSGNTYWSYKGPYTASALAGKDVAGDLYAYDKAQDTQFTKEVAQDYYCTRSSIVFGQSLTGAQDKTKVAWTGRYAGPDGHGEITINEGSLYSEGKYTVGLTATAPKSTQVSRAVTIQGNTSYTHGGGIGCNGQLIIGKMPSAQTVKLPWTIEFDKELKKFDGSGTIAPVPSFKFGLYSAKDENTKIAEATNASDGTITFTVNDERFAGSEEGTTYTLYAKEIADDANKDQFVHDDAWHGVKVVIGKTVSTAEVDGVKVTTTTSYVKDIDYGVENTPGATFTNTVIPDETERFTNTDWTLTFDKKYLSGNDGNIFDDPNNAAAQAFTFGLYGAKTIEEDGIQKVVPDEETLLASTTNNAKGQIEFKFVESTPDSPIVLGNTEGKIDVAQYRDQKQAQTYTFFAKELVSDETTNDQITYDDAWHKVEATVEVSVSQSVEGTDLRPVVVTTYTSSVSDSGIKFYQVDENGNFQENPAGKEFVNRFHPKGALDLSLVKSYYGDLASAEGKFSFTLASVNAPENGVLDLRQTPSENETYQADNGAFDPDTGQAQVKFEDVVFTEQGERWFMVTEDAVDGVVSDTRAYVFKVAIGMADDGMSLTPRIVELYYADEVERDQAGNPVSATLNALEANEGSLPTIEFSNFDTGLQTMSLYGYAVNAASNEPIEQECFVDPKIIKNLEGRSLTEGEFNFKLIELTPTQDANGNTVVDWSSVQGPTISETANDRYGMVDFDKANNVSGDWENPSCLAYTAPGTYYYRVVEANDTSDPSVQYSDQIITFTTVIELNGQGQLECTDMYYGHVENGENIRYNESANPQWHPTMTNTARGADLQVRKTSVLDRDQGLEGATYGLYAVNNGAQADILLGEATSDADGWITFADVNLKEGTLYYFKERLAPAGHTVSEFRSSYFYLVKDSAAPNGYEMHYTDTKDELGSAESAAMPVALDDQAQDGLRSDEGKMLFTFTKDGGVYDEATLVEFAKLDTRTHEWVEGAELSIIEKATGKVVNRWTSGKSLERLEGTLNVDTDYILREESAPEGYAKADDVTFRIDEHGSVSILSGTSNGNAEIQDSTITLYDTTLDAEELVTEYREVPGDEGSFLAKTGDFLKVAGIVVLAALALAGLLFAIRRARKERPMR